MNAQIPVPKASFSGAAIGDTVEFKIVSEDAENFILESVEPPPAPTGKRKLPAAVSRVMDE